MKTHRQLRLAIYVLIAIHVVVLLGAFIAPYDYSSQNREYSFAAPTPPHFIADGKLHVRPFVYALPIASRRAADHAQVFPVRFLTRGSEYRLLGLFPTTLHLFGVDEPARIFLLGTDQYGRDQFSRLLRGGQVSLFAGLLAAALSLGTGLVFGIIAGYYGKLSDDLVMRFAELFLLLPWLYLLLAVKAFLPLNVTPLKSFLLVIAVIGLVGWARPARLIRGVVLTAKERNYVVAARGFGATDLYLLRRHIAPQTLGVILTQATLLVPMYSLSEMALSFLGLGVGEPVPSWGNMLAVCQQYHVLTSYWWMFAPVVPAALVFWAYYAVATQFQEQSE